jgi:hypothetical protein
VSEIGDGEIEERRHLHSATTLVLSPGDCGIGDSNTPLGRFGADVGADVGASRCVRKGAKHGAKIRRKGDSAVCGNGLSTKETARPIPEAKTKPPSEVQECSWLFQGMI